MKVLVIDIDGVLISAEEVSAAGRPQQAWYKLQRKHIAILNAIVKHAPDVRIWSISAGHNKRSPTNTLPKFREWFREAGFYKSSQIEHFVNPKGTLKRGEYLQLFIEEYPEKIEHLCILDDCSHYPGFMSHLVNTQFGTGLSYAHILPAVYNLTHRPCVDVKELPRVQENFEV